MAGIYVLENTINDKLYVGQTVNSFEDRFKSHQKLNSSLISRSICKYGWDNFNQYMYIIPENLLDYFEIEMIKKTNSLFPIGYNLEAGGRGGRPCKVTREKMSASCMGRVSPMKGKKTSEETKKKQSASSKGKVTWIKGKHHSNETILKITENNKGKTVSAEGRKNMSVAQKKRYSSESERKKRSESAKEMWRLRKEKEVDHGNKNI